jgi:alpha-tubulin suppressor-like RCC1 family protein
LVALEDGGDAAITHDSDAFEPPLAVAAGWSHTCALLADGGIVCWGSNDHGELGNGTRDASASPVVVVGLGPASALSLGDGYSCALVDAGLACWGDVGDPAGAYVPFGDVPATVAADGGVARVAAGRDHLCVRFASGSVGCLGDGSYGQLGNGQSGPGTFASQLVDVGGLVPSSGDIVAGESHTCAMTNDAGVVCWGMNFDGQLGIAAPNWSASPLEVNDVGPSAGLTAGAAHTCARLVAGGIRCWGYDVGGALGQGDAAAPAAGVVVSVVGISSVVTELAAGSGHTCAIVSASDVRCWGAASSGQLGNGSFALETSSTPLAVVGLETPVIAIAAGGEHACVIAGGHIRCWGANGSGELGRDPDASLASATPTPVNGL